MKFVTVFFFLTLSLISRAQDHNWWANNVGWDGVTHWSRYLISQPAFLGPNALPVPKIGNGRIDSVSSISVTGNLHFSPGDNTQNISLYANYCLVKDLVSFDIAWVPYERFRMTHEMKGKRHVFHQFYYDKEATGDILLNTNIQVLKKWRKHIDLLLRVGYRFPAGSGFGLARTSDGPGYYFNMAFGKPFRNSQFRWIGMAGFYAWQMISDRHHQNDAFLFGTGVEWQKKNTIIQTYGAGYLGYLEKSGDKPVLLRATMEQRLNRHSLLLGFQQGLRDFEYTSVEFGIKYRFP